MIVAALADYRKIHVSAVVSLSSADLVAEHWRGVALRTAHATAARQAVRLPYNYTTRSPFT
jgi:hypothetical protein